MYVPIVYHPEYFSNIGPHVFPTEKYHLIYEALVTQIPELAFAARQPEVATQEQLRRVHTAEYLADLESYEHTMRTLTSELPLTPEVVEAYYLQAGGSVYATELALEEGAAFNVGGGFHHAFADRAEGFCYINDVAVGVAHAMSEEVGDRRVDRAAVVDCDLHQGNGTARIFQDDDRVFTFSIHQENNYPVKEKGSLDIGLDDMTGDDVYLERLKEGLDTVFARFAPRFVMYVAGVDPFENDQLGGLHVTRTGMRRRDELVLNYCRRQSVPVAVVLAGGYAFSLAHTVEMHMNTYLAMHDIFGPGQGGA